MKDKQRLVLQKYIDIEAYPLDKPGSDAWDGLVARVKAELADDGVSVLRGFVRPEWLSRLRAEGEAVAPDAYYQVDTVNAYNLPLDAPLGADHPAKITMQRENAFVARDLIPQEAIIHQLYACDELTAFIAACVGKAALHHLADPLAGLCLNVLRPGCAHPWHFDINEFTVSMLTKAPDAGGAFCYCPDIRSPSDENLSAVRSVLTGDASGLARQIDLQPGDLQLFKGRFSLHHVTPVGGDNERHSAIFAYTTEPGVVSTPERTKQLFGRVLPAHEKAASRKIRADELLD